jgi:hypothetical protein
MDGIEATAAGLEEQSRGLPGVQYAVQTSMRSRAGEFPHPIRPPKPEDL